MVLVVGSHGHSHHHTLFLISNKGNISSEKDRGEFVDYSPQRPKSTHPQQGCRPGLNELNTYSSASVPNMVFG